MDTGVSVGVRELPGAGVMVGVGVTVGGAVKVTVGSGVNVGVGVLLGVAVYAAQAPDPVHAARKTGVQLRPQLPLTGNRHDVIGTVH